MLDWPKKGGQEWERAAAKYAERIKAWPWSSLGLHFATTVYNTYALPVLAFTAQVARTSEHIKNLESHGLRRAAPGPGVWATNADLWHLKHAFGMPRGFGSLEILGRAAKLRLATNDNRREGGLQLGSRMAEIQAAARSLTFPARAGWLETWRNDSIPNVLEENRHDLIARGIDGKDMLRELASKLEATKPPGEASELARRRLQKAIRDRLQSASEYNTHDRIRSKLTRWNFEGLPRQVADRFELNLKRASKMIQPRVTAAVFGTAWNRWCTERRFQRRSSPCNFCKLGCGGAAEDSIEHYSRCKVLKECHATEFGIKSSWLFPQWIGVHDDCKSDGGLVCGAVGAYASYRTTNAARHAGGMSAEAAKRAFHQAITEAVAGAPRTAKLLRVRAQERAGDAAQPKRPRLTVREAIALM